MPSRHAKIQNKQCNYIKKNNNNNKKVTTNVTPFNNNSYANHKEIFKILLNNYRLKED